MNRAQRKLIEKRLKDELALVCLQLHDPFGGLDSTTTFLLHAQNNRKRERLERALKRVRDGHYGECENCHQPIGERQEIQPDAQYCTTCQQRYEAGSAGKIHVMGGTA
jgi:formamidopyrimidine-DNA glycosylase